MPGRTHYLSLEAEEPGTYVGQCTEYCGLSHAYMRQVVHALPEDEYDAWVERQLQPANEPQTAEEQAGLELFEGRCASCHLIEGVNDRHLRRRRPGVRRRTEPHALRQPRRLRRRQVPAVEGPRRQRASSDWDEIGGELDRNQLEAWLRNPPAEKPMAPDDCRGMPNLGLNEADIDSLVAYLTSLD